MPIRAASLYGAGAAADSVGDPSVIKADESYPTRIALYHGHNVPPLFQLLDDRFTHS